MQDSENSKPDFDFAFRLSHRVRDVASRNRKGFKFLLFGLALCILGISLGNQLFSAPDPFLTYVAITLVGSGLPLVFVGTSLILRPTRPYIYLVPITVLLSIIPMGFYSQFSFPEGPYYAMLVLVSALYVSGLVSAVATVVFINCLEAVPRQPPANERPFAALRERLDGLIDQLDNGISQLMLFRRDLESWSAASWRREKELEEKHGSMIGDLFLLLDHFDILLKAKREPDEIEWICRRTRRILEDRRIEEIPVRKGARFSDLYHEYLGGRQDELPKGTVVEVARKGYFIRGRTDEDDLVLRPAGVIVSDGISERSRSSR